MSNTASPSFHSAALEQHERLVQGLLRPEAYPEPVERVERIDTHISTVLLAGGYAYKLRKPVDLGFLDFTTLERRRRDCGDEVRLNRRSAPGLYLDVIAVTGTPAAPRFDASGGGATPVIDYAVRMRRFDPALTLDQLAARGVLTAEHVDHLADAVAALHARAAGAPSGFGTPESVAYWLNDNFTAMRDHVQSAADRSRLDALADWTRRELEARHALLQRRVATGAIREGHGDLHLGNVVLLHGSPTPFDAIEFNAELRCIDVISDVAFAFMDLLDHGLDEFAWRFISRYLESTGDYDGLALLRLYAVYRALVRAKVALIRLRQPQVRHHARIREHASFEHYLALAERLQRSGARILVVMTGLSGSGKSTVAQDLAAALGGLRIRSDVERKRIFGLEAAADSRGAIYSADATRRTYERLALLAGGVLDADIPVVVDAASLKRSERRRFVELATEHGARAAIAICSAPEDVLRDRVRRRAAEGGDASEATERVLEQQIRGWEALDADERPLATTLDTSAGRPVVTRACRQLVAGLLDAR
ncbi:MAG TPA: AAA family ATPase [Burkholderiaceae bacterium]|nr:AAA family ATPase [Burkholderiaceae bacterium]